MAWFQKGVKQNKKYVRRPHLRYLGPDSEQEGEIDLHTAVHRNIISAKNQPDAPMYEIYFILE